MPELLKFDTQLPSYILLVNYVDGYADWEYVKTEEDFNIILNDLLGDPAKGYVWNRYYPEKFDSVFTVDADEVLIIKQTLAECISTAFGTTESMCLARYLDSLNSETNLHNISFNQYLYEFHDELQQIFNNDCFTRPNLKEYVIHHNFNN